MCDCNDYDGPSCYRALWRKARKVHRCEECSKAIQVGIIYEYSSGIWDGKASDYKTCRMCVGLRDAHVAAEMEMGETSCHPMIGDLLNQIAECSGEDARYLAAFRKARKAQRLSAKTPLTQEIL